MPWKESSEPAGVGLGLLVPLAKSSLQHLLQTALPPCGIPGVGTFVTPTKEADFGVGSHNRTQMPPCLSSETRQHKATTVLKLGLTIAGRSICLTWFSCWEAVEVRKGRIFNNPEAQFPSNVPRRAWHCPYHEDFQET